MLLPLPAPMKKARATAAPVTRRQAMAAAGGAAFLPVAVSPALGIQPSGAAERNLRIEELELTSVRVTERTGWMFVHLRTNLGLSGLGECSLGRRAELPALGEAFEAARGRSPFEIEAYRAAGRERAAAGGIAEATAFSAIEQALWDLVGKAVDAPVHLLAGGRLRHRLPAYANINRATRERTPEGFAAVAELDGIAVSPHNPSGPVATAASAQLCAGLPNFEILEMQWGEAAWRGDLILPPERFENGSITVPDGPGLGVELNQAVAREHA